MTEKLKELAREMSELTTYEQSWILDRFLAQQEHNAIIRELQRQSEARNRFILQQLRYDREAIINFTFESMRGINAKP